MNYKSRFEKKYLILIAVAIILILLAFIGNSINQRRTISVLEETIKDAFLYTTNVVRKPGDYVINKVNERREKNNVYEKYLKLKENENKYNYQENKINALKEEVDNLKEILELNTTLTEYEMVNATIYNRDIGYFYSEITIDKGRNDNILENSAAVNNDGLIGKVVRITRNTSTIELLSSNNSNNRVSIKIVDDENELYGVLSGYNSELKYFEIEGIDEIIEIKKGSKVVTTGLGGIYPKGIKVGYVKETIKDNFDFSKIVYVEPSVCFDSINYVSVLINQ